MWEWKGLRTTHSYISPNNSSCLKGNGGENGLVRMFRMDNELTRVIQ